MTWLLFGLNAKVLQSTVQRAAGDTDEVKEAKLGFYWSEKDTEEGRRDEGSGRAGGEDRYGKGRKKLPTSFDLQQQSLFPTVPTSGKYATYKKTATTCSLQAPCNNSWGQPSHRFPTEVKEWTGKMFRASECKTERRRGDANGRAGCVWLFTRGWNRRETAWAWQQQANSIMKKRGLYFNCNIANMGGCHRDPPQQATKLPCSMNVAKNIT